MTHQYKITNIKRISKQQDIRSLDYQGSISMNFTQTISPTSTHNSTNNWVMLSSLTNVVNLGAQPNYPSGKNSYNFVFGVTPQNKLINPIIIIQQIMIRLLFVIVNSHQHI